MRAREPDRSGYAVNDGVRVYYEVHGEGHNPTVVLMPTWQIVHSRMWKMQVPYLARHFRVVTFDARGNGRTDRPDSDAAYDSDRIVDDTVAVMDVTGTDAAVFVGFCSGSVWAALLHQRDPTRVLGMVAIGSPLTGDPPPPAERKVHEFDLQLDS
jgi:pimeloyl-ACP methyl ester carboxylesterase